MTSWPLLAFLAIIAVVWAVLLWRSRRAWALTPCLPHAGEREPAGDLPLVSVLLPARNEADRMLVDCVRSLLAQDYPRLEVVAVDDRSDDATGAVLRDLARCAPGLRVITGAELPKGWVGKQYALMQAANEAQGEWLLSVDADALYDPSVVRDAIAYATAQGLDALSLLPRVGAGDLWVSLTYPVGFWALLSALPLARVNQAGTTTGVAWGGFFLIRRPVFDAVSGYNAVCAETSEDTKLASLLKRRGYRFRTETAVDRLYTPMYPTLKDLWHGTMKNVYCGPVLTPALALGIAIAGVLPAGIALAAAFYGAWSTAALAAAIWTMESLALVPVYRLHRIPAWRSAFAPVGVAIASAQMLCTTWLVAVTGQGIEWRGRRVRARSPHAPQAPAPPPPPVLTRRRSPR